MSVPPSLRLEELVESYFHRQPYEMFPVVDGGGVLVGSVSMDEVRKVPREAWSERRVSDVLEPCSEQNCVSPYADALVALQLMKQLDRSRLLVAEGNQLAGVLSLRDLLRFLVLQDEAGGPRRS